MEMKWIIISVHNNGYKEKRNPGGSRCIVRLSAVLLCDIRGEKAMDGYFIFPNAGNAFIDAQLLHEGKYRIWGWSSGFGNRNLHGDGNLHSGSNCRTDHIGHLCGGFIGFKKGGRKEQNSFCAVSFCRTGGSTHCAKWNLKKENLKKADLKESNSKKQKDILRLRPAW